MTSPAEPTGGGGVIGTPCAVCGESDDRHGCSADSFCCPGDHDRTESESDEKVESTETTQNESKPE